MIRRRLAIVLCAASVVSSAAGAQVAGTNGGKAAIPTDAAAYVDRRIACDHWAGEEPYDAARARQIAAAAKRLRCNDIEADAARLRRRYARDPDVLKALDAAQAPENGN